MAVKPSFVFREDGASAALAGATFVVMPKKGTHRPTNGAKREAKRQSEAARHLAGSALKRLVGQQIAVARTSLGWTQAELVREYADMGISASKLNQWEAGKHYPDPLFLTRFCNDQGFTMDWFYRNLRAGVSAERAAGLRRVKAETSGA